MTGIHSSHGINSDMARPSSYWPPFPGARRRALVEMEDTDVGRRGERPIDLRRKARELGQRASLVGVVCASGLSYSRLKVYLTPLTHGSRLGAPGGAAIASLDEEECSDSGQAAVPAALACRGRCAGMRRGAERRHRLWATAGSEPPPWAARPIADAGTPAWAGARTDGPPAAAGPPRGA